MSGTTATDRRSKTVGRRKEKHEEDNPMKEILARLGHKGFREGQREPIKAVLRGEDAVAVMATGADKSLCYQVTALMIPRRPQAGADG